MYSIKKLKKTNLYDMYFQILSNFNNQLKVRTDKSDNQEKNWFSNDTSSALRS